MKDKEEIRKLLKLLGLKLQKPENNWMLEELSHYYTPLTWDAFVRLQRNNAKKKARQYYKNIKYDTLRKELVKDHALMLWYKSINELEHFFVYTNYQIENMLNYYITKTDAYEKISKEPRSYHRIIKASTSDYKIDIDCSIYFFNRNDNSPNPPSKIFSLWAKLLYWGLTYHRNIDFIEKQFSNLDAIIKIRNECNHANYDRNKSICSYWYSLDDDSQLAFVQLILKTIRNSIINL